MLWMATAPGGATDGRQHRWPAAPMDDADLEQFAAWTGAAPAAGARASRPGSAPSRPDKPLFPDARGFQVGFGRTLALHDRSSTWHQACE